MTNHTQHKANQMILNYPPAGLSRELAAEYVSLGLTTFEDCVQKGIAPKPRQIPGRRRVVWLRSDLDAWLQGLPISTQLPPENCGIKRSRMTKAQVIAQQVAPSVPKAL